MLAIDNRWLEAEVEVTGEDLIYGEPLWGSDALSMALAHTKQPTFVDGMAVWRFEELPRINMWLEPHDDDSWFDKKCRVQIAAEYEGRRYVALEAHRLSDPTNPWFKYTFSDGTHEILQLLSCAVVAWTTEKQKRLRFYRDRPGYRHKIQLYYRGEDA